MPGHPTGTHDSYNQPTSRREIQARIDAERRARQAAMRALLSSPEETDFGDQLLDDLDWAEAIRRADPPRSPAWHRARRALGG